MSTRTLSELRDYLNGEITRLNHERDSSGFLYINSLNYVTGWRDAFVEVMRRVATIDELGDDFFDEDKTAEELAERKLEEREAHD